MQQIFRRQLLALGELTGCTAAVVQQCQQFIRGVLAAPLAMRPHTEAVLDVLLFNRVGAATAACFAETFDAAVWRIAP